MERRPFMLLAPFLSTPSARRATRLTTLFVRSAINFYPRPPRGGRLKAAWNIFRTAQFLSTPSARRATFGDALPINSLIISIHALREEGDRPGCNCLDAVSISIHALREEGDPAGPPRPRPQTDFYPRPPRGGRPTTTTAPCTLTGFLSTPSARRATWVSLSEWLGTINFYPRPPRGERLELNSANFASC